MRKAIVYILLFLSALAVLLGLSTFGYKPSFGLPFLIAGILGVAVLYLIDKRLDRRLATEREEHLRRRAEQVSQETILLGRPLIVRGASGIGVALLFLVVGGSFLFAFRVEPLSGAFLAGALSVALGVFLAVAVWPTVGRPKLVLSLEEISTPKVRRIPWSAVHGIDLQAVRAKGRVVSHVLTFLVPELERYQAQMHPMERLLYRFRFSTGRKRVSVPLKSPSEDPELVYNFALELWKRATGRDYPWHADMPEEAAAAFQRMSDTSARMDKTIKGKPGTREEAEEVLRLLQESGKDREVLNYIKQRRRRLYWVGALLMVGFVLVLALQFLSKR